MGCSFNGSTPHIIRGVNWEIRYSKKAIARKIVKPVIQSCSLWSLGRVTQHKRANAIAMKMKNNPNHVLLKSIRKTLELNAAPVRTENMDVPNHVLAGLVVCSCPIRSPVFANRQHTR